MRVDNRIKIISAICTFLVDTIPGSYLRLVGQNILCIQAVLASTSDSSAQANAIEAYPFGPTAILL